MKDIYIIKTGKGYLYSRKYGNNVIRKISTLLEKE
jgi:hypothetical protein